jgi:putative Mg2+ transporter-C (MgtC) family protein
VTWVTAALTDTTFTFDGNAAIRLLSALVLGGLVGLERETSDQAAGLRTHIAVALGAALFGVISTLGFLEVDQQRANSTIQADVSRVASNVVVGIGFLGAGVIFRQGGTIKNLTTAASLWAVAAVGLACGVGDVTTAAVATLVLLGSLVLLRPVRGHVRRHWARRSLTVRVRLGPGADPAEAVSAFETNGHVETSHFTVAKEDGQVVLSAETSAPPDDLQAWLSDLAALPEVEAVDTS